MYVGMSNPYVARFKLKNYVNLAGVIESFAEPLNARFCLIVFLCTSISLDPVIHTSRYHCRTAAVQLTFLFVNSIS